MSWIKWKSEDKSNIKLEGCLAEDKTILCVHKNHADSCWFCLRGIEPIDNTNTEEDPFESSSFKSKLGS